jgi:hypothetical protein
MARQLTNPVPHPIFQEPLFNEAVVSGDPAGFQLPHPSDDDVYKQIEDLLTEDVVGFEKSRMPPGEIFKLEDALGPRGTEFIISGSRSIITISFTNPSETTLRPSSQSLGTMIRSSCQVLPSTPSP